MHLRPPFRADQSNAIRLIRISHYAYHFIRSLVMPIRWIQVYSLMVFVAHSKNITVPRIGLFSLSENIKKRKTFRLRIYVWKLFES